MGLLDILNGMQNGPRGQTAPGKGGMSPITMALLALLAYKAYQKMGTGAAAPAGNARVPAPEPGAGAPGAGGGLGDLLGGLLGGGAARGGSAGGGLGGGGLGGGGLGSSGLGGLLQGGLGGLGGLLAGGAAGSVLGGGLGDLLKDLQQAGHTEQTKSWVGTGPNQDISPNDLGQALGDDTVNSLAEQAGLSRVELLSGLSQQLPQLVDQLTPDGRLPTDQELSRML